ncbi:hypothetical protein J2X88_000314 [Pseudomonas extremaustralis]|jgi:hypothetical protein|nr:hypothetical protein [Pseudomonas extremaustralis]
MIAFIHGHYLAMVKRDLPTLHGTRGEKVIVLLENRTPELFVADTLAHVLLSPAGGVVRRDERRAKRR